jgi:hypothetical protein
MGTPAKVTISDGGSSSTELSSLREWLARERAVRSAHIEPLAMAPEYQGGILDTISLVLADGAAAITLTDSIRRWVATRHKPPASLTITLRDGAIIKIENDE